MRSDLAVRARAATRASAVVYVLIFVTAVAQTTIVPLLPTVQHRYGLDASTLAWILTLPSLAMLVTATPLGILGDRIGNRRVTAAAGVVIALSVLAQGVPSLPALVVARLGFGVGYGALWTAGLAWLAGAQATGSSRRLAATVTASAVGSTIGPTLSGTLASHFGFAAPFVVAGAVTTIVAGLLVVAPEPPGTEPARPAAAADAPLSAPRRAAGLPRWRYSFGGSTFAVLRRPVVLAGAATLALSGGVASLLQLLVPLQLHSSGHS
ncbi:MAG: MFS transporter, partial [Acidimicrobiales bacterium]